MKLRQIGEDRLLAQLVSRFALNKEVVAGPGDDCAVVKPPRAGRLLLLKTDCVIEGIHFAANTNAAAVGRKAMMRPLSDFAAMSGIPQFALITVIAPAAQTVAWTRKIYRGLEKAACRFGVSIVGGETSATSGPATISVSISGFVEKGRWVSRTGGRIGDELFVTGRLGGSASGKHLRFIPRIEESRWLTENFSIHAMMDLSDGLGADLPRLARASNVGFEVNENALPLSRGCTIAQAINDGEDYELVFAIGPRARGKLQASWKRKFPRLPLTRIGRLTRKSLMTNRKSSKWHGYLHFA